MSKKDHQFRCDLLSEISSDLIEKGAANRCRLINKLRPVSSKRPFFSRKALTSAIAALLLLAFGTIMLWFFGNNEGVIPVTKQVPIYEGMTVSTDHPSAEGTEYAYGGSQIELLSARRSENESSDLLEELYKAQDLFNIPEQPFVYYAEPQQDIYITVHLSNPDNFEILSFTLNGVKYSSYMFEDGSDMENLVLKCNVGDAQGLLEYSIDAIKYVDGESIKDVHMEGDRTVKVGVYTAVQPTASTQNAYATFNTVVFTVTAFDTHGLMNISDGKFYAVLYDGKEIIRRQELTVDVPTTIRWGGLPSNTDYQGAIIGVYDALDGNGIAIHILAELEFTTNDIFALSDIETDHHSIRFVPLWDESYQGERKLLSLTLYDGDEVVQQLDESNTEITGLLANHTYRLVAVYVKEGQEVTVEQNITTQAYEKPKISFYCFGYYPDRVEFDITVLDLDQVGELIRIELLDEDRNVIQTGPPSVRNFTGLDCPITYTVRAVYSYDLQDGNGPRKLNVNCKIVTQSEGLSIRSDGMVTGMGSCTDRVLYINMPVEPGAFSQKNITKVVFGSNATYIGGAAFRSCPYLEEVILAEGVETIDLFAFESSPLKYPLYIPASVTSISTIAFDMDGNVPIYCSAAEKPAGWEEFWTYADENVVWNFSHNNEDDQGLKYAVLKNGELIVMSFDNSTDTVVLPEGVVEIRAYAFRATRIKEIVFPSTVRSVGERAFASCQKLKNVVLNEGLTSIGMFAFAYNNALEEIVIPSTIQTLGMSTFFNCRSLKRVTLQEGLTTIPYQFLAGCYHLTTVNIPSTVTRIEGCAFNGCGDLTGIVFPEGLQYIGEEMFTNCYQLRYFVLPESLQEINFYAFDGFSDDPTKIFLKTDRVPAGFNINWRDYDDTVVYFGFQEWYTDENGVLYACLKDGSRIAVE
ncbi:MAG: leucine-rich repeat domain-containing protein [Clostridia bacterium]|nr:leucine-rich repeat domain-containing protein [Clostridia bacterium]